MKKRVTATLAVSTLFCSRGISLAQQRTYLENGVTYHETTRRVRTPVTETRIEEREQTVYRPQYETEIYES